MILKDFVSSLVWTIINKLITYFRVAGMQTVIQGDKKEANIYTLADRIAAVFRRIFIDNTFETVFSSHYFKHKEQSQELKFTFGVLKTLSLIVFLLQIVVFLVINNMRSLNPVFLRSLNYMISTILGIFLIAFFRVFLNVNKQQVVSAPIAITGNIAFVLIAFFSNFNSLDIFLIGNLLYTYVQVIFYAFIFWKISSKKHLKYFSLALFFIFAGAVLSNTLLFKKDMLFFIDSSVGAVTIGILLLNFVTSFFDEFKSDFEMLKDFLKELFAASIAPIFVSIIEFFTFNITKFPSHLSYSHKMTSTIESSFSTPMLNSSTPYLSFLAASKDKLDEYSSATKNLMFLSLVFVLPFVFLLSFLNFDLIKDFLKDFKNILNKNELAISICIVSISIVFELLNKILMLALIVRKEIYKTAFPSIIISIITFLCGFYLNREIGFIGIAIAGNIGVIFKTVLLLLIALIKDVIKFNLIDLIDFCFILFTSFMFSKLFSLLVKMIMVEKQFGFFKVKSFLQIVFFIFLYTIHLLLNSKYIKNVLKKEVEYGKK